MKITLLFITLLFSPLMALSDSDSGVSVGTISTNDYLIEIKMVDNNSKFVVKNLVNKSVSGLLTEKELSDLYPELGKLVQEGIADHAAIEPDMKKPKDTNPY